MKKTGGLRKIRFAEPGSGKGKSGSYRVGYFAYLVRRIIVLAIAWPKNAKGNLNDEECNVIRKIAKQLDEDLL